MMADPTHPKAPGAPASPSAHPKNAAAPEPQADPSTPIQPEEGDAQAETREEKEAPLSELDLFRKDLQETKQQLAEANNRRLRALADYENLQKRTAVQVAGARLDGVSDFLKRILPVLDTFESALRQLGEAKVDKKVMDGFEMLYFQLTDLLDKEGLKPIPAKGEKFNPNVHEAMTTQSQPEFDDDVVITEYEKGYTFKDRVLRHAKVVINRK